MLGHHLGQALLFLLLLSHIWSIWSTDFTTFQQQLISRPTDSFQPVAQALKAVGLYNPTRPWSGFYLPIKGDLGIYPCLCCSIHVYCILYVHMFIVHKRIFIWSKIWLRDWIHYDRHLISFVNLDSSREISYSLEPCSTIWHVTFYTVFLLFVLGKTYQQYQILKVSCDVNAYKSLEGHSGILNIEQEPSDSLVFQWSLKHWRANQCAKNIHGSIVECPLIWTSKCVHWERLRMQW